MRLTVILIICLTWTFILVKGCLTIRKTLQTRRRYRELHNLQRKALWEIRHGNHNEASRLMREYNTGVAKLSPQARAVAKKNPFRV